jgi:hypothetical protein
LDESFNFLKGLLMKLKPFVNFFEDSNLKDVGIVGDHHGKFGDSLGINDLGLFDFGDVGGVLHDSFLDGIEDLLDHLPDPSFHLKPFELFDFEFLVLIHWLWD